MLQYGSFHPWFIFPHSLKTLNSCHMNLKHVNSLKIVHVHVTNKEKHGQSFCM